MGFQILRRRLPAPKVEIAEPHSFQSGDRWCQSRKLHRSFFLLLGVQEIRIRSPVRKQHREVNEQDHALKRRKGFWESRKRRWLGKRNRDSWAFGRTGIVEVWEVNCGRNRSHDCLCVEKKKVVCVLNWKENLTEETEYSNSKLTTDHVFFPKSIFLLSFSASSF